MGRLKTLRGPESPDEGIVLVPFGFTVNGTSDPVKSSFVGDELATVVRNGAGKWTLTFKNRPAACYGADVDVSIVSDTADLTVRADWSSFASAGTVIVRSLTATTPTDPANGTLIGGLLVVKKTTRRRRTKLP